MFGIVLLVSAAIAPAQDLCPSLNVASSTPGKGKANYFANLSGGDPKVSPTYNWTISAGTISSGQGTSSISVDADPDSNVTATLEVGGYAPTCSVVSSSTETITAADAVQCSVLGVEGGKTDKGETIFKATANPIPSGSFTFNWSVSAGTISAGQGTGNIIVKGPKGADVTATMDVGGLAPECPRTASGTFAIQ